MAASDYFSTADTAANHFGIPTQIFRSLISTESSWNASAVSNKGAIGLTQLMPGTAAELGVDPNDPMQNIAGGARYLSDQFKKFGNWQDALAAYNAGPGNIKAGQGYAEKVLGGAAALGWTPDTVTAEALKQSGANAASAQTQGDYGWFSLQNFLGVDFSFQNILLYGVVIAGLGVVGYFGVKSLFAGAFNEPGPSHS